MNYRNLLVPCSILSALGVASSDLSANPKKDKRPNVIVILADDLGYSDLGCYGGEIQTPNLDGLAQNGIRFNSFYNTGRSCPTRASLLTGLYQHQAGIGRMTFDDKLPGYRGTLSKSAVTIGEVLKGSGYNTGVIGKWHVAETPLQPDQRQWLAHQVYHDKFADKVNYPTYRGFDDFYGIIYGVVNYFDPFSLVCGEEPVRSVPENYYITQALSDTAVDYVNKYADDTKPFFMYLSYTAPHWPLHALPEDIAKYEQVYKVGWDAIREQRYERMKKLGLFEGQEDFLSPRQFNDRWEDNPNLEWDARAMAVHAAMVDRMDRGIGQLLDALKKSGELDNTLIFFMSDNGASNEECQNYSAGENDRPDMTRSGETIVYPRKKELLPGAETSYAGIGAAWANVVNTPFRMWKSKSYDGGICTPMIAHWPKGIKKSLRGEVNKEVGHIMDIMATCVELSGATYPQQYDGVDIIPMEGKSLVPILKSGKREGHDYIGFEHFHQSALISKDGWKIVRPGAKEPWELYNLNVDRTELNNVAASEPTRVESMAREYSAWAKRSMVEPFPGQKK